MANKRDDRMYGDDATGQDRPDKPVEPSYAPQADAVEEQRTSGRREPMDRRESSLMERLNDALHRMRPRRDRED